MLKIIPSLARNLRTMSTTSCQRLVGKVAVVTASTDGIGLAIARRIAEEGGKVVISSRRERNVNQTVESLRKDGLNVCGTVCHVSNSDQRKRLFEFAEKEFGCIDILVSNAAANPAVGPVLECEESSWDKIFDVNVKSSYLLAKESLPYLRKRGGGSIVFVSSIAGLVPFSLLGAYSVSKTALIGLTKAAAQTHATENIRVNCVAPGIIKTKFASAITESEVAKDQSLMPIAMNRFGQPHEIGAVVAFLVSDDASYITGEVICATGGMPSRL